MAQGGTDQRGREKQERGREGRQEPLEPLREDEHPRAAHVLVHAAERDEGGRHDHECGEDDALQCDGDRLSNQVCQGYPFPDGGDSPFKRYEPNVSFWNIRGGLVRGPAPSCACGLTRWSETFRMEDDLAEADGMGQPTYPTDGWDPGSRMTHPSPPAFADRVWIV